MQACRPWSSPTADRFPACLPDPTASSSWPMPLVAVRMRPMNALPMRSRQWTIHRLPRWSPPTVSWPAKCAATAPSSSAPEPSEIDWIAAFVDGSSLAIAEGKHPLGAAQTGVFSFASSIRWAKAPRMNSARDIPNSSAAATARSSSFADSCNETTFPTGLSTAISIDSSSHSSGSSRYSWSCAISSSVTRDSFLSWCAMRFLRGKKAILSPPSISRHQSQRYTLSTTSHRCPVRPSA